MGGRLQITAATLTITTVESRFALAFGFAAITDLQGPGPEPRHGRALRLRAWRAPATAVFCVSVAVSLFLSACATAPISQPGELSSYDGVVASRVHRTHAQVRADAGALKAAHTFELEPVRFAAGAGEGFTPAQRDLLANTAGRALCEALSQRLNPPAPGAAPDLLVRARITGVNPTGRILAASSFVLGHLSPIPLTPRIPIGMGSLAAEAEALDGSGHQVAVLVWERGADAFTSDPAVSSIGDAYQLSELFGRDMGDLIVTGADPIRDLHLPDFVHGRRGKPVSSCAVFGKKPSLVRKFVGGHLAMAPEWMDRPVKSALGTPALETPPASPPQT